MKEKFISENVHPFLRPKTEDEMIDAIRNLKINSYRLSSYFKTTQSPYFIKPLIEICKELKIEPSDMEIFMPKTFVRMLFIEVFDGVGYKEHIKEKKIYRPSPYNSFEEYAESIEYSTKYKIIRLDDYFVFPRNEIKDLMGTLALKYFYNENKRRARGTREPS